MRHGATMLDRMMAPRLLVAGDVLPHQRPAPAVAQDLPIGQLVARADRPLAGMDSDFVAAPGCAVVRLRRPMARMGRAMVRRMGRGMMPDVHEPVPRRPRRHRREGRRRGAGRIGGHDRPVGAGLAPGRRRSGRRQRLARPRLLSRGNRLVVGGLLRRSGRSKDSENDGCAEQAGRADRHHSTENSGSRTRGHRSRRAFSRTDARLVLYFRRRRNARRPGGWAAGWSAPRGKALKPSGGPPSPARARQHGGEPRRCRRHGRRSGRTHSRSRSPGSFRAPPAARR